MLALLLATAAFAQQAATSDAAAEAAADAIVRQWAAGELKPQADRQDPIDVARKMMLFSEAPRDVRVSYELRKPMAAAEGRRAFRYPITSPSGGDEMLNVTVAQEGGEWVPTAVQRGTAGSAIPAYVTGREGPWIFLALTALLAYLTLAPTVWRRWMGEAWRSLLLHRRVYLWTNVLLYGAFLGGMLIGSFYPRAVQFIQEVVTSSLQQGGITEALSSGGVPTAAFGIAYWNFTMGAVLTTFVPGVLLGVLAYLYNFSRLMVLGIAFAPGSLPLVPFLLHVPTIVVELQAYIIVTAGSGVLLSRVLRGGMAAFPAAFRAYLKTLTLALVILVVAAWYEAWEILWLIPRVTGS